MSSPRHAGAVRASHWLTVALLVAAFALIWWREGLEDSAERRTVLAWHLTAGILVAFLTLTRILRRRFGAPLPQQPDLTEAERKASTLVHLGLYGLLVATPVVGYLAATTRGHAPGMFDHVPLPTLMARNRDLAEVLQGWHEWLAIAILVVVGLHVAGALFHHFIRKDGVLRSML